MIKKFYSFTFLLLLFACSSEKLDNTIVIGVDEDIQSFNPLYAFNVLEGDISELIFPSLYLHQWDSKKRNVKSIPSLANEIEWTSDKKNVRIHIKDGVHWSDGKMVNSDDIKFSLYAYSNKKIESRFYGSFDNYYLNENSEIIIDKTFEKIDSLEFIIHFAENSKANAFDFDFPILPSHKFKDLRPEEIAKSDFNSNPVTAGAYGLETWSENQAIILKKNTESYLINSNSVDRLIFKIIPSYISRLNQLKTGEVQFIRDIKPEDAMQLRNNKNIRLQQVNGRQYDYIGWNNIDPEAYQKGKIIPNKLFGNERVRKALTMSINRSEIIDEFFGEFASIAESPIPNIFLSEKGNDIIKYNPNSARKLLRKEGWYDSNGNKIIDKNGVEFKFDLIIPQGNPIRKSAAELISNNLNDVGIKANVKIEDLGVIIPNLYEKKYNAWLIGWFIPIPFTIMPYWNSNLDNTPNNFVSFRKSSVDTLLLRFENSNSGREKRNYLRKLKEEFVRYQPVTFLYWNNGIAAYSNKIKSVEINPLGDVQHCWNWKINP